MALQGNLRDMAAADLIQQYGQSGQTAVLHIHHGAQEATLYIHGGTVAHAVMGDQKGEEVVYEVLTWTEGEFSLEMGEPPPETSITRSWSGLLLEGARRLDEAEQHAGTEQPKTEVTKMAAKRKSDRIADVLSELLQESADIEGAAVVGIDGLVYSANVPHRDMDVDLVGAAAAATLGLSKRSVQQFKRGNFTRTLVQGDAGNIIVVPLNEDTLLAALTPAAVNLGMAFAEVRDAVAQLTDIL
jgi:predicted regulator of Ras-like GTPase activity (Roadblock/LC7/MglB family)